MHPALQGALVGLGVGAVLYFFEVVMLNKAAAERAQKLHRKAELDQTERKRIATVLRFALMLPFLFGAGFWLVSQAL